MTKFNLFLPTMFLQLLFMNQNRFILKIATLLLTLFLSQHIFTQSNDSTYLNYLLKNNNVPKRTFRTGMTKNILKTNIIQLLDGELQTIWEHHINDLFGFDIGPGLILPYTLNKYIGSESAYEGDNLLVSSGNLFLYHKVGFENKKFGFSFQAEPKFYFNSKTKFLTTDHSNSIGPFYHFRSYSNLLINEIGLAYTYIPGFDKITYVPSIAFSYTIQTPMNSASELKFFGNPIATLNSYNLTDYTSFRIYFRMNFGYIFN